MPYIKPEIREAMTEDDFEFRELIDEVINHIRTIDIEDREGICNYTITRIVAGAMKPQTGWRYKYLNRAYGTFFSAAAEFNRRLMSQYENLCIERNGDIPEYETF